MEKIPVLAILIRMYMLCMEECPAIPFMPWGSLQQTAWVLFPTWVGALMVAQEET